jgi:Ca2+-binding EF-hand superfamily protein
LEECLDDIWDNYDEDGNGQLEYKEAKKFLKDVMKESGIDNIRSRDLKKAFDDFDEDGSGAISKDEMKVLIRMLTGI